MKPFAISQLASIFLLSSLAASQVVSDNEIANRVQTYLTPFVTTGNFTGAVLVARTGKVLLRQGYGHSQLRVACSKLARNTLPYRLCLKGVHSRGDSSIAGAGTIEGDRSRLPICSGFCKWGSANIGQSSHAYLRHPEFQRSTRLRRVRPQHAIASPLDEIPMLIAGWGWRASQGRMASDRKRSLRVAPVALRLVHPRTFRPSEHVKQRCRRIRLPKIPAGS
jgi:hypothetical protein